METILITGSAGFIGFHTAASFLKNGANVIGIDNLNSYYDISLKMDRLKILQSYPNFTFKQIDILNVEEVSALFDLYKIEKIIHLAAQAGVRYSLNNPEQYIQSNIVGFSNMLEVAKKKDIKHFVFASSSSVYGSNAKVPFSTTDNTDRPMSLYAATKKSNEILAYSYSQLYKIPITGLRFFTVYGPWGRPDMAYFSFTKKIYNNEAIQLFNNGEMIRDFTYVDDVTECISRILEKTPQKVNNEPPFEIINIGNSKPQYLKDFIEVLRKLTGKEIIMENLPMQPGDVPQTFADISNLTEKIGYSPSTSLEVGMKKFIDWYNDYYKI